MRGSGVFGLGCGPLVAIVLLGSAFQAVAKPPRSLPQSVADQFDGKTLVVEVGATPKFLVGPRSITDKDEFARLKQMLGDALPEDFEGPGATSRQGMWAVDASNFGDPTPAIALALSSALQERFGLVLEDGAPEDDAGYYLLSLEPFAWQLYRRSAFADPAHTYSVNVRLFAMPAREPLVARGCLYANWHAVEKKPFLLNYFGDDAAAFRADVDKSRSECIESLLGKMLPPGKSAGN